MTMTVFSRYLDAALHTLPGTILCPFRLGDRRLHEAQGGYTGVDFLCR